MGINVEDTAEGRKKRVVVRKNAAQRSRSESEYVGLNIFSTRIRSAEAGTSEEIQILDVDFNKKSIHPLLVLFPDLKDDPESFQEVLGKLEPEQVTKKLVGKKANMTLLKKFRKVTSSIIELHQSGTNPLLVISEEDKLSDVILSSPSDESTMSASTS